MDIPFQDALELGRLRSFLVFAEHCNFTRAARELALTQPALFAQVKRLATDLGVELYRRKGRSLELSPEGVRVQRFAREWIERSGDFVRELHGVAPARSVRLAAGEGAYLYLLGAAIREHRRLSPFALRLLTRDAPGTLQSLRSGEADAGVAALTELPQDLHTETLRSVGQNLVLPRGHALAKKRRVTLDDLEDQALIVPPVGRPHRTALARALLGAGVSWRVAVEVSGWELMLHLVQLGLGIAVVNDIVRVPRGLVARPLRGLSSIRYQLITRPGERHESVVELCALLRKHAHR
ncbi:MAG: LysR family transcriptional regulator [Polyangiaceae bacterium]